MYGLINGPAALTDSNQDFIHIDLLESGYCLKQLPWKPFQQQEANNKCDLPPVAYKVMRVEIKEVRTWLLSVCLSPCDNQSQPGFV